MKSRGFRTCGKAQPDALVRPSRLSRPSKLQAGSLEHRLCLLWLLACVAVLCGCPSAASSRRSWKEYDERAETAGTRGQLARVEEAQVCWSLGAPEPALARTVLAKKSRALLAGSNGRGVELLFRFEGLSKDPGRLGSGEVRHQIGLRLRARDTCNGLYVMWRMGGARPQVVVSEKSNPSHSTHRQCGNRGYRNLKPRRSRPPPRPQVGEVYGLSALLQEDVLTVRLNQELVWEGSVGPAVGNATRAGLRSDNVQFEWLELKAHSRSGSALHAEACP